MNNTLTWHVGDCSGGLCDRLLGLVTSYLIAKHEGRRFLIKWDYNDMSDIFTISPSYNFYTQSIPYYRFIGHHNHGMMEYFEKTALKKDWMGTPHIVMWSNLNLFKHYCKQHPDIDYEKEMLDACKIIFSEFLILTDEVKDKINDTFDLGLHIRTHDSQLESEEARKKQIPYIQNILDKCKVHLQNNFEKGIKIFVASDCVLVPDMVRETFGEDNYDLVFNTGPTIHSGRKQDKLNKEGLVRVILDLIYLSRCEKLYIGWNSNFSRFGVLLAPKPFWVYEYPGKDICTVSMTELMGYFSDGWRMR